MSRPNWDEYFINFAKLAATRSKDPSNQVGAVIVKNNNIIATGYNGFPSGVEDDKPERYERPLKYFWMVHAEENALLSAAKHGIACEGANIYVTPFHPCAKCARGIIQAGIKNVIVNNIVHNPRYEQEFKIAKEIFQCAGVKVWT